MKTWLLSFLCLLAILFGLLQTGCSSSQKKSETVEKPGLEIDGRPAIRFSENPLAPGLTQRKYERMTKQRLEEESDVQANAGSLWVMEGQGAYLFAQNKVRKEGDVLNIRIEGAAQKQIESKVSVIRKLLKQLEEEEAKRRAAAEAKDGKEKSKEAGAGDGNLAQSSADATRLPAGVSPAAGPEGAAAAGAPGEKEESLDLQSVPSKVVDRLSDGTYRVKGSQAFMIGKKEYKVLVTGLIRAEDYNEEGVSSTKLFDSQFDVVSLRRKFE